METESSLSHSHKYPPPVPILSQISPVHALPSNFLKKKQNFIVKKVQFSVILYGCETWALTFKRNIVEGVRKYGVAEIIWA
jgi:hypothetical protein